MRNSYLIRGKITMLHIVLCLFIFTSCKKSATQETETLSTFKNPMDNKKALSNVQGDANVHDPCVFRVGSTTYCFSTGPSIRIRKTTDPTMETGWSYVGYVWTTQPAWIAQRLGATPPDIWAPDVNFWNGKYYLYYAASIVGNGLQATMGLMTATNIEGPWTDQGEVTNQNYPIDPDLQWVGSQPYMTWGSWGGTYIAKVDPATGKLSTTPNITKIASGIEAPSIVQDGGYFYLMGSKGTCCSGVNSTYYTVVGRASSITGPYSDVSGKTMLSGGGTTILTGMGNEIGTGGGDWFSVGSTKYFGYHFYDTDQNGRATLDIRQINFSAGWPVLAPPIGGIKSGATYNIINSFSKKGVTVPNSSTQNNTIMQQFDYTATSNQKYVFTDLANGYYRISPAYQTSLALDGAGTNDGARVQIYPWWGGINQQWQITASGSHYKITNRASGKVLDIPGYSTANNAEIDQYTWNGGANQLFSIFRLTPIPSN